MKNIRTVIALPGGIVCNLACRYCYYEQLPKPLPAAYMPSEILEALVRQTLELAGERILFLWHGGEPMLAGVDFYSKAHDLQQKFRNPKQLVANHMQTNLTLVTQNWVDELLKKRGFRLSTSIDGPSDIHDANRVDINGKGVLETVLRNKDIVEQSGFPVGVLTVITQKSMGRVEEIHNFLKRISKNSWDYSLCFELNPDGTPSELTPKPREAAQFLIEAFDIWFEEDNPNLRIRSFFDIIRGFLGHKATSCQFRNKCADFIGVDQEGNIYPCPRFIGMKELCLGNVMDNGGLSKIVQTSLCEDITNSMETAPSECSKCPFIQICGTGCAYQRYISSGKFDGSFYFCGTRKLFFQHVLNKISPILNAELNS